MRELSAQQRFDEIGYVCGSEQVGSCLDVKIRVSVFGFFGPCRFCKVIKSVSMNVCMSTYTIRTHMHANLHAYIYILYICTQAYISHVYNYIYIYIHRGMLRMMRQALEGM